MATDLSFSININGIEKTITSTAELSKVVKDLTKTFVENTKAGKDVTSTLMSLQQAAKVRENLVMVSKGAVQMQQGMQGAQTASANASMALLNLNYVIRDSPYFFNNFALGVLAVGNNLNPLIDSFNRLRQEAGTKSLTTFALLKQALVGGAGISIAFSIVVTAIQSYVFWMSKADRETEKTKDSVDLLADSLGKMTRIKSPFTNQVFDIKPDDLPKVISQIDAEIRSLETTGKVLGGQYFTGTGETRTKIDLSKLQSDTKDVESTNAKIKEYLIGQKTELLAQQKIYDALRKVGLDMVSTEKDKTKEIEKQVKAAKMLQPDFGGGVGATARRGFYAGETTNKRFGMRQAERTRAFGFGGAVKELDTTLELAKIGAQELGSALEGAFTGAKIKLSDLINQITVAITKMLILQGITSLLTGGLGASASVPSASVGGKEGMWITSGWGDATRFKKQSVNVTVSGRFRANGKEFIADFKNAEKQIDLMRL